MKLPSAILSADTPGFGPTERPFVSAGGGGGGGGASGIYELDDDGTLAGGFGYLTLATNVDNQSFDQTLTASDGANIYFGINSDPFGTGKITVGSDIIAIGFTITANTGSALNLSTAGTLGGFGVIWNAGANNYTVNHQTTSGSNRNHRASPVWNNTTPGDGGVTQTYANLVSKDYKYILYFNGATKRIGRAYYNYLTLAWVDQGYDSVDVFVDGISPFVFVDNDAAAVAGLDGTVQSGSLKTDATWLSQASSVLPAGCKTFDGTVI